MTTKEPPRVCVVPLLIDIASTSLAVPPAALALRRQRDAGIRPITLRRSTPLPSSTPLNHAISDLRASADVSQVVATAPFWAHMKFSAARFDAKGVPSATAGLSSDAVAALTAAGVDPARLLAVTLPGHALNVYDASAQAVSTKVPYLPLAESQAEFPQVYMALALGMGENPQVFVHTGLLIDSVCAVAAVAVHRLKHVMQVPRPVGLNPRVVSLLPEPKFSAFPGGHATLVHALAVVLGELTQASDSQRAALEELADDIGLKRETMGLHCALDTAAGKALGQAVGRWMIAAAKDTGGEFAPWAALFALAADEWKP